MDLLAILRTIGSLGIVLAILLGSLWLVRRYDIKLPSNFGLKRATARLQIVEKLPIDSRRFVAIIARDGDEYMILVSPEGLLKLDTRPALPNPDKAIPDVEA